MKKFLLLVAALVMSAVAMNAQDLLTKNNGDDLQVIVKEVNANDIKYVLFSEPNGVVYTMPKSEIMMIRYASGRKEIFTGQTARTNNSAPQFAPTSDIRPGMKYKELQKIYDPKEYNSLAYDRYSPVWAGIGSFFIPGLGQMCCGEFGRGLGQVAVNVGLSILANVCAYNGAESGYYIAALTRLGYDIWSIIDAVRVAKVKNMYEIDLRSMRSSVEVEMYPSLNAVPMQGGLGVAPGMTLSLTF